MRSHRVYTPSRRRAKGTSGRLVMGWAAAGSVTRQTGLLEGDPNSISNTTLAAGEGGSSPRTLGWETLTGWGVHDVP